MADRPDNTDNNMDSPPAQAQAQAQARTHPPSGGIRLHLGGMAEGTRVLTALGPRPVEEVRPGDRLITRNKGMQRVIFISARYVEDGQGVSLATAPFGGVVGAPPLILAPSQRIALSDWRARAMFGRPRALVPVRKLIDREFVKTVTLKNMRLYSLHFDEVDAVYAGQVELGTAAPVKAFLGG